MDIMLDIETLGVVPHSVITQIGAMPFEVMKTYTITNGLSLNVDVGSCLDHGGVIQGEQFYWTVNNNLKSVTGDSPKSHIVEALVALAQYIKSVKPDYIWCKGPQFDCVILESWYREFLLDIPWTYNQLRDVRTLEYIATSLKWDLTHIYTMYGGNLHDALNDCKLQADICRLVLGSIHASQRPMDGVKIES